MFQLQKDLNVKNSCFQRYLIQKVAKLSSKMKENLIFQKD